MIFAVVVFVARCSAYRIMKGVRFLCIPNFDFLDDMLIELVILNFFGSIVL